MFRQQATHAVNYLANVAADPLYGSYGAVKSISNTPDFFAASVREEAHHSPNIRTMGQAEHLCNHRNVAVVIGISQKGHEQMISVPNRVGY